MKRLRTFLSTLRTRILSALLWLRRRIPLILGLALAIVVVIEFVSFLYDMSGSGFSGKTLWDWLSLLIVPLILAIGGVFINSTIQRNDEARSEKRAETERQIADDRLKEQALQTYLDRMGELLMSGQFENPVTRERARTVARARTLTTLRGLNSERKSAVIRFLSESGLVTGDDPPLVDLSTADLQETTLAGIQLKGVNLTGANLVKASLVEAHLDGANFARANLADTNMERAHMDKAHMEKAALFRAHLKEAQLFGADLEGALLFGANLKGANLENANLKDAVLFAVKIEGANLKGANLKGVFPTPELKRAILDEHTILPNGSHWKPPSVLPTPGAQLPPDDGDTQNPSNLRP